MQEFTTIWCTLCGIALCWSSFSESGFAAESGELPPEERISPIDPLTERVELLESRLSAEQECFETASDHWSDVIRPGDFPHSILIPGTNVSAKLGGYIKGDLIYDFDAIGSKDNFDTITIPTDGRDGENTRLHARQTRLNLDARWSTDLGPARAFVEGDFFGVGSEIRLRHAYAEFGPLLVGETWTTFTHIEALPETIDFESPGAFVLTRRGMVRWTWDPTDCLALAFAVEDPRITVPRMWAAPCPNLPATAGASCGNCFVAITGSFSRAEYHLTLRHTSLRQSGSLLNACVAGLLRGGSARCLAR